MFFGEFSHSAYLAPTVTSITMAPIFTFSLGGQMVFRSKQSVACAGVKPISFGVLAWRIHREESV